MLKKKLEWKGKMLNDVIEINQIKFVSYRFQVTVGYDVYVKLNRSYS